MIKKICILLFFGSLCCYANNDTSTIIGDLVSALATLNTAIEGQSNNVLLGAFLLKKYLEDIFSPKLLTSLNLNGKLPSIISYDANNKLYQVRCLQGTNNVGCRAIYNCIYLMESIFKTPSEFPNWYAAMLNPAFFNQFITMTKCSAFKGILREPQFNTVLATIKKQPQCKGSQPMQNCLPLKAYSLENYCVLFNAYTQADAQLDDIIQQANKLSEAVQKEMPRFEDNLNAADVRGIAADVKILTLNSIEMMVNLLNHSREFQSRSNYSFVVIGGISLDQPHQVCLVANKSAGKVEYLFADPLNAAIQSSKWSQQYLNALNVLLDFIEKPSYLEDCLTRAFYFTQKSFIAEYSGNKDYENVLKVLKNIIVMLQKTKLYTNDLYQREYKFNFLDLVTVMQRQDSDVNHQKQYAWISQMLNDL